MFRVMSSSSLLCWINIIVIVVAILCWQTLPTVSEQQQQEQKQKQNFVVIDGDGSMNEDPNVNKEVKVHVINKSRYRADFYYDNGMYGSFLGIVEANGGKIDINSHLNHEFFVTRHGVKEGLFDTEANEQIRFVTKGINDETFEIPENAGTPTEKCLDRFKVCEKHAKNGMCNNGPGWMIVHCCKSCDEALNASQLIDPKVRCTRERLNMTEAIWKPGDLDALFYSWSMDEKYQKYDPHVISSPLNNNNDEDINAPWVITFDNFATDEEVEALIKGGQIAGFQRSTDQGAMNAIGEREKIISKTRTSSNAWCNNQCERLPGVKSVTSKIEDVTGIPSNNYESFQILEYDKNQFYRSHHDTNVRDPTISGPRILTFFLYLTDVEEGGETHFTKLNISVKPKKGRALVWPSVTNDDPSFWDARMHHEAKPVIKGKKIAANHWIHLYDYRTPNTWGCTGSFS